MKTQTYYASLGLAQSAPLEVIRAAYEALTLKYHLDDTTGLDTEECAARAAMINDLQQAFDVLNHHEQKAAYDIELAKQNGDIVDEMSASRHCALSTPEHQTTVTLATQDRDSLMRAQARRHLQQWLVLREERRDAEACLNVTDLKSLVGIWEDLEAENAADPTIKARCTILAHEYMIEIDIRERDLEDRLAKAEVSRHTPVTPTTPFAEACRPPTPNAPTKSTATTTEPSPNTSDVAAKCTRPDTSPTPMPFSRLNARAAEHERAEEMRVEEAKARAEARRERKAQVEAAKQAALEEKAAFVRALKVKQKAIADERARLKAEHIAKVRAKVRGAPMGITEVDVDFVASGEQGGSLSHRLGASDKRMQGDFKL